MIKKLTAISFLFALILFSSVIVRSQQPPPPRPQPQPIPQLQPQPMPPPPPDPIGENLFPPDFVMQHQQAIGLTDDQVNAMKSELQKAQNTFTDPQWQLSKEVEIMASIVREPRVNEQQALSQLDKILGLEREIKRTQITLAIRIKNILTPEQQARLQQIRHQGRE